MFFFLCVCVCELLYHVRLFVTPWTVARQAPPPMWFSRQEYWRGLPRPSRNNTFVCVLVAQSWWGNVCVWESCSVVSDSLWPNGLYSPWNSPGKNTGVGSLSLLQGIFPTQGWNLGLPHCWQILYQLSHKGSPRILEWVAYPFPSGSSQPRDQTGVSYIAGGFFTNWAIREANSFR